MINVKKHDGRLEPFNPVKIKIAVLAAGASESLADSIAADLDKYFNVFQGNIPVDDIHDAVELALMKDEPNAAKSYILYRQKRTEHRQLQSDLFKTIDRFSKEVNRDNANAANSSAAAKMHGIAEAASKEFNLLTLDKHDADNHRKGRIYIHDLAYRNITFNCFFNPIADMLYTGFMNGGGGIRPPKRILSALAQVAIILQSSQNSLFGGQGVLNFDSDLAPFVQLEFERQLLLIDETCKNFYCPNEDKKKKIALQRTEQATYQALEAFVHNMNTMRSRSAGQAVFSSVNFGTDTSWQARMISRNLLKAFMAGLGNGENPIFPNMCYRLKDGINLKEGDPNFDITEIAIECVGKRIQPRFVFCDSHAYDGLPLNHIGTMGCRTAIRSNINGDKSPDGRGNIAFNTICLPFLALEAKKINPDNPIGAFKDIFCEAIKDAAAELIKRYDVLCRLKKRDIPFVADWYQGGRDLQPDDSIEPMIKNGTLSIGFIGLAECLKVLVGKHHGEDADAQNLGLNIIRLLRSYTDQLTKNFHFNFSTFATPAESACYTLLKACRKEFGIIEGVTDKDYFTNSFHLPVDFECDAKTKIDIEAPYHLLCNAGAIFYLETERSPKFNPEGMLKLLQYVAKSGIVYGGVNWKHAFCRDCHHQGDFQGSCPKCGSTNIQETAIITGYLSETNRFNDGKQAELKDRKAHLGGNDLKEIDAG